MTLDVAQIGCTSQTLVAYLGDTMKTVSELTLGFPDAENYKRRENKDLFNQVFIRNRHLDRLCEPAISFLVGEKGTGKTAYAVYMTNNDHMDTRGSLRYIRETDYQKFITLKRERHLQLSDYTSIWKSSSTCCFRSMLWSLKVDRSFFGASRAWVTFRTR